MKINATKMTTPIEEKIDLEQKLKAVLIKFIMF